MPDWSRYLIRIRGGTNTRLDPDTSGNRCTKPDPRYLTRLSAKVLISRIPVYFILIVPFSLSALSSWCQSSENCCPINRLATTRYIPLNKAENIEEFIQPASAYIPDTRPESDFLGSFTPIFTAILSHFRAVSAQDNYTASSLNHALGLVVTLCTNSL